MSFPNPSFPFRPLPAALALLALPALLTACTRQRAGAGAPVPKPGQTTVADRPTTEIRDRKTKKVLEVVYADKLAGANLHGANLAAADLDGADLSGAELRAANLTEADLHGANLSNANLARCILINADLRGANLEGATLAGAVLSGAKLDGVKLAGARDHTTTQWPAGFEPEKHGLVRKDYSGP
jgi:hypothetical protein